MWSSFSPKVKSRMRLQASLTMLHLARMEIYSSNVMQNFVRLALTIQVRRGVCCHRWTKLRLYCQDTCYGVRSTFLNKLILLFIARKLPPPLGLIFFLTVHDPEEDVKTSVSLPFPPFSSIFLTIVYRLRRAFAHY